jgi:hypothetical protein
MNELRSRGLGRITGEIDARHEPARNFTSFSPILETPKRHCPLVMNFIDFGASISYVQ